jgi:hypothetical protein
MQNKADELEVTYEELVDRVTAYVVSGAYWNGGEAFEGMGVGDEFWDHYTAITGRRVKEDDRGSFFTCSC